MRTICFLMVLLFPLPAHGQMQSRLFPSDPNNIREFGKKVDIDGERIIVLSRNRLPEPAAYIFKQIGSDWVEEARLEPVYNVAISGTHALVSGGGGSSSDYYVSVQVLDNGQWTQQLIVEDVDTGAFDIDGNYAAAIRRVAYAQYKDVLIYQFVSGEWSLTYTIETDDTWRVALCGDYLLVQTRPRKASIYKRIGNEWLWQTDLPLGSIPADPNWFIRSLDLDGDYAILGAKDFYSSNPPPPIVNIYKREGDDWTLQKECGDPARSFGVDVAIRDPYAAIGRRAVADGEGNGGHEVLIYRRQGSTWEFERAVKAEGEPEVWTQGNAFGNAVAINGLYLVSGAPSTTGNDTTIELGAAYVNYLLLGDCGRDGDVDIDDFVAFRDCFTGPGELLESGCGCVDFDNDGDVDCADWLAFSRAWTGGFPMPVPEECMQEAGEPVLFPRR